MSGATPAGTGGVSTTIDRFVKKQTTQVPDNVRAFKRRGDTPDIVYEYLLNKVINMHLSSGARIEERAIVEELGISRTPVREAFVRMAAEGLIEILPNRGAWIPPLGIEEVRSFLESFEFLLLATGHLATQRRTDDDLKSIAQQCEAYEDAGERRDVKAIIKINETFHLAVARAGHNGHLERLMGDLLKKALRVDWFWYSRSINIGLDEAITISVDEHNRLAEAVRQRDAAEVESITIEHVQSFRKPIIDYLNQSAANNFDYSNLN